MILFSTDDRGIVEVLKTPVVLYGVWRRVLQFGARVDLSSDRWGLENVKDILALRKGIESIVSNSILITGFPTKAQAFPEILGPPRKIFDQFRGDEIT